MSLWIESFQLKETVSGTALFSPADSNWSLDGAEWLDAGWVRMQLRCYPGDHVPGAFEIEFDCEARVAAFPDGRKVGAAELDGALAALNAGAVQKAAPPLTRWQRLLGLFRNAP